MADQAALIATLSLRMDKFEKQMADAGKTADKAVKDIENKFEKANPQLGGAVFKGTLFGNLAAKAAKELVSFLKDLPEQFRELAKAADVAQVSMVEAFSLAGVLGGMDQASKLLQNIGLQLEKIRQGATDTPLQRLFDANNITIGKDAITVTQQIVDLLRRATTAQQELAIASGLVSREMVQAANAGKNFKDVEDKVVKLNTGFQSLIDILKQLTLQAEIWGLTLLSWIAKATAGISTFFAENARGLARMGANVPDTGGELPSAGRLRQLADAARDAEEALKKARGELEALQKKANFIGPPIPEDFGKPGIKIPVAGAGDENVLQRELDRIEKRIELLKAEKEALGENAGETARLRAEHEGLANLRAKDRTPSEEEIRLLKEKAAALGRVAEETDKARKQFEAIVDASRTVGSALSTAFADAVVEGKKLNDVLKSLEKTLLKAAISSAFGSLFGKEGLGGLLGGLAKRQHGGPVSGGRGYIVGEKGPELFVPRMSGRIVPGGGGAGGIHVAYNIDATGADQAAIARLERALIATNASIESRVRTTMREDMRRRA